METMFWVPIVRDVISVTGKDAASYLHSQLSQDVASMEAGDSRQSFLISDTGIDVQHEAVEPTPRDA